ncbi:DUF1456 family protein [Moritella sp. Urea-trap-13]|uniref:DUF1456 family protein n=1 Tax=Moritella sp. Urea-trap-13 TaxID=2058327 RepID=UPI000C33EDFA|nr:DUF1456 family protein [Moritella sp. Urea-trap-13]PKH07975.1 DUF1456 domain-containing protein [Moritella sp. Urea-trap-13]
MTNNDILRRIRYTFNFSDDKMITLFKQAEADVTRGEISDWLKKDEDPACVRFNDTQMATFLNGLINANRGKKDGPQPEPEHVINNNIVLRKLKIALDLKNEDVLELLEIAGFRLGKHELSAFFRKPDHKHFRECKDQVLRNFLAGLQIKHRPEDK